MGVVEEAAVAGVAGALLVGVVVVQRLDVPAAVGGHVGDGVRALGDQLPQVVGRGHPAGETAAHRDDGDGVVVVGGGGGRGGRGVGLAALGLGTEVRGEG